MGKIRVYKGLISYPTTVLELTAFANCSNLFGSSNSYSLASEVKHSAFGPVW